MEQTRRGGANANAYKLTLDNNGGIYIMFSIYNLALESTNGVPVHFSEDDVRPYWNGNIDEQDALKRIFLLKYDTEDGDLIWRKDIHGNISPNNWFHNINHLQIDSNNVLHTVVGFDQGVHLDGQLTVPELGEDEGFKYYLLKFNHLTGNLIGTPLLLPMGGIAFAQQMSFRYDETLDRYYIVGFSQYASLGGGIDVSFNGVTFGQQNTGGANYCFVISFNPNNLDDWWYKEITMSSGVIDSRIQGIEIDSNSDIYITGGYYLGNNSAFFGDHAFSDNGYINSVPFILKMNSQGEVQWSSNPDSQGGGGVDGWRLLGFDLTINGDEVAMATVGTNATWGDFSMSRPDGHGQDPVVVRFDKQTGEVVGLHDILGYAGENNYLTSITADNDGNYVVGGAMRWVLFWDEPNGIERLYNTGSTSQYTDFFFARLANSACGESGVSTEVFKEQTLKLYPNPTRGLVHIEATQELQSYEVYNLLEQRL